MTVAYWAFAVALLALVFAVLAFFRARIAEHYLDQIIASINGTSQEPPVLTNEVSRTFDD